MANIVVSKKYCGPPGLGNGGYVAGLLSKQVDFDCEVMLKKPTPLDKELVVSRSQLGVNLMDDEQIIATVSNSTSSIKTPPAVSLASAERASKKFIGYDGNHPFPNCFVCGPDRLDGLRIFVGQVGDSNIYAAPWIPNEYLVDKDNQVKAEFIWAALDCPGAFAIWVDHPVATLLGKIKTKILFLPNANDQCIIQSWLIESQGRKHRCGTALYSEQGQLMAFADSLWISPKN